MEDVPSGEIQTLTIFLRFDESSSTISSGQRIGFFCVAFAAKVYPFYP
jgi:hypothetical protein